MKHYVIVGASSGIGMELAKLLSSQHRINALSRTVKELETLNNTTFHEVDIALEQPNFPIIDGPIDGLIYCPGTITLKPFRSIKQEDYLHDWNINFLGAVKSIKQYLPQLQQAEQPNVVLFSSVAAGTGMAFHASIAAAKGAVESLTRSLAAEFAPKIRFNAIAPSLTNTPLAEKLLNAEAKVKSAEERHPLKTIGNAKTIAEAAAFLLESSWITGEVLHIDGGLNRLR